MKNLFTRTKINYIAGVAIIIALMSVGTSPQEQPTTEQRVAAIKQSMQVSQKQIRQYQWVETTMIYYKGEEKSSKQDQCSYGADGKVQKTPIGSSQESEKKEPRGIRGHIIEKKEKELSEYMKEVETLIHAYVPPNPELIQKCKDAGKVAVDIIEPNKRVLVNFSDYHLTGDMMGIELDIVNNIPLGYKVSSYIDEPKDSVNLNVSFATLEDKTVYAENIVLDATAKEVKVDVKNSDYKKLSQ